MSLLAFRWFLAGLLMAVASPAVAAEDFSYLQAVQILQDRTPRSVEDFMGALPTSVRNNYILMHDSQSDKDASQEFPRILLFNQDASVLMAFSGNPSGSRGGIVELIRFDQTSKTFIPSEINFAKIDPATGTPQLRERPQACLGCHGGSEDSFHPNWRAYDNWPGAFGNFHAGGLPARPSDQLEFLNFKRKLSGANKGRYKFLGRLPLSVGQLAQRNSAFTSLVAANNVERVSEMILKALATRPEFYPAIFSALAGESTDFFNALKPLNPPFDVSARYAELLELAQRERLEQIAAKKALFNKAPLISAGNDERLPGRLAKMRLLEELGLELKAKTWATILLNQASEFTVPQGSFFKDVGLYIFDSAPASAQLNARLRDAGMESFIKFFSKKKSYSIRPVDSLISALQKRTSARPRADVCSQLFR